MMRALALLALASTASAWWKDEDTKTRGEAPYPYPATHSDGTAPEYAVKNEKDGIVEGKINVHLVPHTHDDTGWQVTVDQYFFTEVYYVVDTVVDQLVKNPKRHFIYVETGFFARWWDEQPDDRRNVTRGLVKSGQLEFINGAWCMHDEASPFYVEMVDQTTRGHQFLRKNFGEDAIPRGTWQIDPFGHSNTEAWLLGEEAGFESLFWGRTDYQDLDYRKSPQGQANNQWPEWVWQGSQSLGKSAELFAGELTTGGYGAPIGWDNDGGAIQDNPSRHDYNLDSAVDAFIMSAINLQNKTKLNHQMWPCGSDFQYQNADHWFHNLDKIIHYVNYNASKGGPVVAFYSTPSHYVDAKFKATTAASAKWEVRHDDIFPLGDAPHNYWSGYFTSRPSLKRQVRFASNFLNSARQMEVISGVTAEDVNHPTTRPSPPVGQSWTDSMEGAIGVATHHDGMSGTERQDVSDDYSQRISEGHFEVEAGVAKSLQKLAGITEEIGHCNCNAAGNCLNMSMCAYTTGADEFTVLAWNPTGQKATNWLRIPVSGAAYSVTDLSSNAAVPSQATLIDNRTHELPLLYINKFGMKAAQLAAEEAKLSNKATHVLTFEATTPPVGYSSFKVKKSAASDAVVTQPVATPSTVSNGVYELTINQAKGSIDSVKNLVSGVETTFNITWGYYVSSEGHATKTKLPNGTVETSGQASGAYMFRPDDQFTHACSASQPTIEVTTGPLVTEIKQVFSSWATHIIRLTKGSPFIEVEWTAGPIPWNEGPPGKQGKELVVKFSSGLSSDGVYYTDSNGREMLKRKRDARGPSYPPFVINEPVAENYYPVNSMISLDDGKNELAVVTDVTMGGASMKDGELEVMVHRRCQKDDSRGVQEPINETMCGCNDIGAQPGKMGENGHEGDGGCDCQGLTMRGSAYVVFDTLQNAHKTRRELIETLNFPPTLAFTKAAAITTPSMSAIAGELPANVKLMTISSNYKEWNDGKLILRLAHKYAVGEHATLSMPAKVDLATIFAKQGLKLTSISETLLTANQPREPWEANKKVWPTEQMHYNTNIEGAQTERVPLDESDPSMSITIRAMELKTCALPSLAHLAVSLLQSSVTPGIFSQLNVAACVCLSVPDLVTFA